jgi:hypothetical protein
LLGRRRRRGGEEELQQQVHCMAQLSTSVHNSGWLLTACAQDVKRSERRW